MNAPASLETTTLGGGCFWCLEAVFEQLRGVKKVESGYSGGLEPNPTYKEVCSGRSGHAEVVQVAFDPHIITFRELLEVFFVVHDPTTLNRQGADVGTQYRSVVFCHTPGQSELAHQLVDELNASGKWSQPIVTQIVPFEQLYKAEGYHQEYYRNNPTQPYCKTVVEPKVAKLRQQFLAKLKSAKA